MRIICVWCKKFLYGESEFNKNEEILSHGICKKCKKKHFGDKEDNIKRGLIGNPPSSWHEERIRVAQVNYKKDKRERNFWKGGMWHFIGSLLRLKKAEVNQTIIGM